MKSSETEKVSTQGFEKSQVTISQHVFCNKSDDTLCFTVFLYGCLKTQCRCMYNKKEFFCTNLADIFNKLLLLIWWFVFSCRRNSEGKIMMKRIRYYKDNGRWHRWYFIDLSKMANALSSLVPLVHHHDPDFNFSSQHFCKMKLS